MTHDNPAHFLLQFFDLKKEEDKKKEVESPLLEEKKRRGHGRIEWVRKCEEQRGERRGCVWEWREGVGRG